MTPRFIPFSVPDITRMCLNHPPEGAIDKEHLVALEHLLSRVFLLETGERVAALKAAYQPHDPDTDLQRPAIAQLASQAPTDFKRKIQALLERANFEPVSEQEIQDSLGDSTLVKLNLRIDFSQFDDVFLYYRGASQATETVKKWWGLKRQTLEFTRYDRVFIFIRLKHNNTDKRGAVLLRLFQNVPKADLEMLFPNTQVGLRLIDKVLIGVPAVVSGVIVVSTKLGATLVLLGSLIGFYLGWHTKPITLDQPALIALGAGFGAVISYIWKQFSSFKNRKLKFAQTLTRNLYFKLLDTNAGVFHRIADSATDEELKETLLAYYFLAGRKPMTATELDDTIQHWFATHWQCKLNFEIEDALSKLERLGLAKVSSSGNALWHAEPIKDALTRLQSIIAHSELLPAEIN